MAGYNRYTKLEEENLDAFLHALPNPLYSGMYNSHLIGLYADKNLEKALARAENEIENRATPKLTRSSPTFSYKPPRSKKS